MDFIKFLRAKNKAENNKFIKFVINEIINYSKHDKNKTAFANDVIKYGCSSGIWRPDYSDTKAVFKKYGVEIVELIEKLSEQTGENLPLYNEYNFIQSFVWITFERTARDLFYEFNCG